MFGREYANHIGVLVDSFKSMNDSYQKKVVIQKQTTIFDSIKKIYILLFGIPEIGFQVRSLYFHKLLKSIPENSPLNILDAGSGIGAYTFRLAKYFPNSNVKGVDIDRKKIQAAKRMQKEMQISNLTFDFQDISQLSPKTKYDIIVIIDVLEHIPHYEKVLKKLYTLLHKSSYLYIHVPQPNQKRIFSVMKKWHHDDHVVEGISQAELKKTLKRIGFKVLITKETFGIFGKIAWELNHIFLSKSFVLAGITFPLLYPLIQLDSICKNKRGLCVACLAQKK